MSRLKAAVLAAIRGVGLEVRRAAPHDAGEAQRRVMAGVDVGHVIDAGAYHGEWTGFYRSTFPRAIVHAFEPFPESLGILREKFGADDRVRLVPAALSDSPGDRVFHSNEYSATNSLLPAHAQVGELLVDPGLVRLRQELRVRVTTIDAYAQEQRIDHVGILKMDIQGAELSAIRGANGLLSRGRIDLVYTEILLAPQYESQPAYFKLCRVLHEYGYALYGLYNLFPQANGRMGWCDGIFLSPATWERLAVRPGKQVPG